VYLNGALFIYFISKIWKRGNHFVYYKENDDDSGPYYIMNEDGDPVEHGDYFELHHERWKDWDGYTSGNFALLRLPGTETGPGLRSAIAGGIEAELSDIKTGTTVPSRTGNVHGNLKDGIETRISMAGPDYCKDLDDLNDLPGGWYDCALVVIVPLVVDVDEGPSPKPFKIVGYASLLLDLVDYGGEKYIYATFLEYLSYEDLVEMLPKRLESFTIRLVKDPVNVF